MLFVKVHVSSSSHHPISKNSFRKRTIHFIFILFMVDVPLDFGLSRSVNYSGTYLSSGKPIPIKWSALESILTDTYTSKSDVWSFG